STFLGGGRPTPHRLNRLSCRAARARKALEGRDAGLWKRLWSPRSRYSARGPFRGAYVTCAALRRSCALLYIDLRSIGAAGQFGEQFPRKAHFRDGCGLLEWVHGIAAGVFTADQVQCLEQLVSPGDRGRVYAAQACHALERHLGAPVAVSHALFPVQPEHALGGLWQALLPEPALERLGSQGEIFLPEQTVAWIVCIFNRHNFSLSHPADLSKTEGLRPLRLTRSIRVTNL